MFKKIIEKSSYNFNDLIEIMSILREKCPWDKVQTHCSIRNNFIEEVYEAIEAIDTEDAELLKEELGDVLLQVVFHSEIAKNYNEFTIDDVLSEICKKLIHRHPHIFDNTIAENKEQVLSNWDNIKKDEKGHKNISDTLSSVSKSLPALLKSEKIQKRAAKSGFEFDDYKGARAKIIEELAELDAAISQNDNNEIQNEIGDLLFSVVNLSRFFGVNSEQALYNTCDKFVNRFTQMESLISEKEQNFEKLTISELDEYWEKAKAINSLGINIKTKLEEN